MLLSGCTGQSVLEDSRVTVATSGSFFSLNDHSGYGNTPANRAIAQTVNSSFAYYNDQSELVLDESFGRMEVISNDPFRVHYELGQDVVFSDGVAVDASDLLLAWVANSGALNTPEFDDDAYVDPSTGEYIGELPEGVVHFDGAITSGLQYAPEVPELGDDGRSLTLTYDHYFIDWQLVLDVGVPAHVVAGRALGIDEPDAAKQALIDAVVSADEEDLAAIAAEWNSAYNFAENPPDDADLLISNGPYVISELVPGDAVTLTANPRYRGDRQPTYETVVVRTIADPLAQVQALESGDVDVISPQLSADVTAALDRLDGVTIANTVNGTYEHLDLTFGESPGGVFTDPRIRSAFLLTVPRDELVKQTIGNLTSEPVRRDSQLFLPGAPGYSDAVEENGSRAYDRPDIDGARELLAEAGVAAPTVCLLYDPSNPRRLLEFQLIRDSAAAAGFRVTDCSSPDWLGLLGTASYDAALFAWDYSNLSVTAVRSIFGTGEKGNLNGYSNETVDDLILQLSVTPDEDEQLELRIRLDEALFADGYGVPLYQYPATVAFDDSVTGISPAPLAAGVLWNVWDWAPADAGD